MQKKYAGTDVSQTQIIFQESVFLCYIKMKKVCVKLSYTERTTTIENKEKKGNINGNKRVKNMKL